ALTYVWTVNGTIKQTTAGSASLTDTFDLSVAGNGDTSDVITVQVTPNDGTVDGTTVGDSATVGNTAPVVDTAVIDQATARTDDVLTSSFTAHDVDGDALSPSY